MAAVLGVLPGVKTQQCSGGCSANVPGRDVAAAHTWLQGQISPGDEMQQRSGGCSANVFGREVVAACARLQCRAFCWA
jgi:hypothetical protein